MVKDSDPESNHFLAALVPKTSITPCIVRPPTPPNLPTHTHFFFLSTHSSFHSILPFSSRVISPIAPLPAEMLSHPYRRRAARPSD